MNTFEGSDYVVHAKLKNNLILKRILAVSTSVSAFCTEHGLSASEIGDFINLRKPAALKTTGEWCAGAVKLANALAVEPDELFTFEQRHMEVENNEALIEVTLDQLTGRIDPVRQLEFENLASVILKNANLSKRQQRVIHSRFYEEKTFKEIGDELGISSERVRNIEAKAFRRLRCGAFREKNVLCSSVDSVFEERSHVQQ